MFKDNFKYERQSFFNFLSKADYESNIDKAISDVPILTKFIADKFDITN